MASQDPPAWWVQQVYRASSSIAVRWFNAEASLRMLQPCKNFEALLYVQAHHRQSTSSVLVCMQTQGRQAKQALRGKRGRWVLREGRVKVV